MESFVGRLGEEGIKFINQLVASECRGRQGYAESMARKGGEGTPGDGNRLDDHTGRHFAEGVRLQAPSSA